MAEYAHYYGVCEECLIVISVECHPDAGPDAKVPNVAEWDGFGIACPVCDTRVPGGYEGADDETIESLKVRILRERAAREAAEAKVREYESAITWGTTCLSCSQTTEFSYSQTRRAEEAEAKVRDLTAGIEALCEQSRKNGWPVAPSDLRALVDDPAAALAEVRAEAWDEGYEAGRDDESFVQRGLSTDPDADEHPHSNPYRAEAEGAGR